MFKTSQKKWLYEFFYNEALLVAVDSSAERLKCIFLQQKGYCTAHGWTILTKFGKDFVGKNTEYFKI
jgi:hypothetical protein